MTDYHTKSATNQKHIAVIGAGKMTGPLIDYFIDICKYEVTVADIDLDQPQKKGVRIRKYVNFLIFRFYPLYHQE